MINMTTSIHNIYLLFLAQTDVIQFSIDYGKKVLNWLRTRSGHLNIKFLDRHRI